MSWSNTAAAQGVEAGLKIEAQNNKSKEYTPALGPTLDIISTLAREVSALFPNKIVAIKNSGHLSPGEYGGLNLSIEVFA